jgi:UDP-sugar transporter A1/2/3
VPPAMAMAAAPPAQMYKWITLVLLVLQNSATAVVTGASRAPKPGGGPLYTSSVAVLLAELLKMPICLLIIAGEKGGLGGMAKTVWKEVFVNWRDTLTMAVPALCYSLQNLLFFVALTHMSAPAYQLWSQTKTLFTAIFFVTYLKGDLSWNQWLSLALLSAGVGWVQGGDGASAAASLIGIGAVVASSMLSGFANVYLEKRIKRQDTTIWVRNVQLGLFGIPQSASLVLPDMARVKSLGLLVGFGPQTWVVVALKALGGLLVAGVVKYADNILKTFATALAIMLTCLLTPEKITPRFVQGVAVVLASLPLYNDRIVCNVLDVLRPGRKKKDK